MMQRTVQNALHLKGIEIMYKSSKFNFFYDRSADEIIVYNTFSKAVIALDPSHAASLRENHADEVFTEDEIHILVENGMLIETDFDELDYLRYYNNKVRFTSDYFCLTIAPTLSCNFDCPYCFENKRPGIMSREVQERIIEFVEEKIKGGVKTLEITWYGGEPLLCFNIIREMCEKIVRIAEQYGVRCKMGMITNGYLITEEVVNFLEQYSISVQITLDGTEQNHNQRRYLADGSGTFQKVFSNLQLFCDKKVDVYVRMNVDNYNRDDFSVLSEMLDTFCNPRMILYPAVTEPINERKANRSSHYMSDSGYDDFIAITRRNGLFKFQSTELPISNDVSSVPDDRCYFCAAELDLSCVIDEKGRVYKCWNEVGHDDYCFSLLDRDKINFTSMLRYMGDHTFSDTKCSQCTFLPLCFGGCKFHRFHLNRYACAFTAESLISYLEDSVL